MCKYNYIGEIELAIDVSANTHSEAEDKLWEQFPNAVSIKVIMISINEKEYEHEDKLDI